MTRTKRSEERFKVLGRPQVTLKTKDGSIIKAFIVDVSPSGLGIHTTADIDGGGPLFLQINKKEYELEIRHISTLIGALVKIGLRRHQGDMAKTLYDSGFDLGY
jgi:hypothetical protein